MSTLRPTPPDLATCPTDSDWRRLLADPEQLTGASAWGPHVEACEDCRKRLQALTGDDQLRAWRTHGQPPDFLAENAIQGLLARYRHEFPTPVAASDETHPSDPWQGLPASGDWLLADRYRVIRRIASGGMGVVYEAFDGELRRSVAIKFVRADRSDDRTHRALQREARAAAGLRHPNIVTVFSTHVTNEGDTFLVMELVQGESLAAALKRQSPLDGRTAAEILAATADGLAAAHAGGLIHGDVKPSNILLDESPSEKSWRPRVTDFGVARAIQPGAQSTLQLTQAGTPAYMSPEQVLTPDRVDIRSDVYGLGVTLYECLTGQLPFRGTTQAVLQQIAHADPVPPRQLCEQIPRDLQTMCLKAMSREPGYRYATAAHFADDLRSWLNDEPITARPLTPVQKWKRWCRRQPITAALTACLLVLVPGFMVTTTTLWLKARHESSRANHLLTHSQESQRAAERAGVAAQQEAARAQNAFRDSFRAIDLLQQLYRLRQKGQSVAPEDAAAQGELLQEMFAYYERILRVPLTDDDLRREAADACFQMALLGLESRIPGLIAALQQAGEVYDELARAAPQDVEVAQQAGKCHMVTGQLWYQQEEYERAAAEFGRARDIFLRVAQNDPHDTARQRSVIAANGNVAAAKLKLGHADEAAAAYRNILTALQTLQAHEPENVIYAFDLAKTWFNLAHVQPLSERLESLRQCLALREKANAGDPDNPITLRLLGRTHLAVGHCLNEAGELIQALSAWESAYQALSHSAELQPLNMETQLGLAECELARGNAYRTQEDAALAAASWQRAIASCRHVLAVNADDSDARKMLEQAQAALHQLSPN